MKLTHFQTTHHMHILLKRCEPSEKARAPENWEEGAHKADAGASCPLVYCRCNRRQNKLNVLIYNAQALQCFQNNQSY